MQEKIIRSSLILLGGMGSRVQGQSKYLFEYQGESFLSRQIRTLTEITDEIILSCRNSTQKKEVEDFFPYPCVVDEEEGKGPAEGIRMGTIAANGDLICIVACDMPLLNPEVINFLFHRIGSADVAIPGWEDGYVEPLHAVYRREALIGFFTNHSAHRLRDITDVLDTRIIPVDEIRKIDPGLFTFTNINDPESFKKLQEGSGLSIYP